MAIVLVIFEKTVLTEGNRVGGRRAAAMTAMKAARSAYSIISCPRPSLKIRTAHNRKDRKRDARSRNSIAIIFSAW